jgi:hypothetical protein
MRRIPFVRYLLQHVYLPLLWRSTDTAAKLVLAPIFSSKNHPKEGDFGGHYFDAMGNPYYYYNDDYHVNGTCKRMHSFDSFPDQSSLGSETVNFTLLGEKFTVFRDPVRALQFADERWSVLLWNVSLALLENTPAEPVLRFAP